MSWREDAEEQREAVRALIATSEALTADVRTRHAESRRLLSERAHLLASGREAARGAMRRLEQQDRRGSNADQLRGAIPSPPVNFPGNARITTSRGPLDVRLWATATGYAAELLDGTLSAIGETRDEALARLTEAVECGSCEDAGR